MAVYVDESKYPFGRMIMCHMMADTLDELHAMADKIGIQRKWFQDHPKHPHYDISKSKRDLAVANGAIQLTSREMVIKFSLVFKKYLLNCEEEIIWKCFWCGGEASETSNGDMHQLLFDKIICSKCWDEHNNLTIRFGKGFTRDGRKPVVQLGLFGGWRP